MISGPDTVCRMYLCSLYHCPCLASRESTKLFALYGLFLCEPNEDELGLFAHCCGNKQSAPVQDKLILYRQPTAHLLVLPQSLWELVLVVWEPFHTCFLQLHVGFVHLCLVTQFLHLDVDMIAFINYSPDFCC